MLIGTVLLIVAIGALVVIWKRGAQEDESDPSTEFAKDRIQARLPVADPNTLPGPPTVPPGLQGVRMPEPQPEDEGMKTEVFTRGNLDIEWDEVDGEGEATEVFRADLHGLAPDDMGFEFE